jgi:hypothetical protein
LRGLCVGPEGDLWFTATLFGGRLHSFSEEEANVPGFAKYDAGAANQTYRMPHDFIQDAFEKRL